MAKRQYLHNDLCQSIKRRNLHNSTFFDNPFALHEACRDPEIPIKIVQDIYHMYPQAAMISDDDHNTPLSIAVDSGFDDAVVFLANVCPQASSICNNVGNTPLQAAIYGSKSSIIIDSIIIPNPGSAFVPDTDGDDAFRNFFKNWNVFARLIVNNEIICDEILNKDTGDGEWKIKDIYDKTRLFLNAINLYKKIDAKSTTLFHTSLREESCHFSFCKLLMKLHPDQVLIKDINGNLPIHIIAASKEVSDEETFLCVDCFTTKSSLVSTEFPTGEMKYCCKECFEFEIIEPMSKSRYIKPCK